MDGSANPQKIFKAFLNFCLKTPIAWQLKFLFSKSIIRSLLRFFCKSASGNDVMVDEKIIKAFQHYHDSLISAEVVIPYAGDIASFVSQNGSLPISARRSFKRVLSAIKTMTLIYQKQRRRDEQGRFIADYIDYAIVYQLLEESLSESLGDIKRYTDDRIRMVEKEGMMWM